MKTSSKIGLGVTLLITAAIIGVAAVPGLFEQGKNEAEPTAVVSEPVAEAEPEIDRFAKGKEYGYTAAVAAQDASNYQTWDVVAELWGKALAELKRVPEGDPSYAEAQQKIEEYRANLDVAVKNRGSFPVPEAVKPDLQQMKDKIAEVDPDRNIVAEVRLSEFDDDGNTLEIIVTPAFLAQNKAVRLEAAKNLWQIWAGINSASDPDKARIWLKTQSGTRVGGSRPLAGSLVYVDE